MTTTSHTLIYCRESELHDRSNDQEAPGTEAFHVARKNISIALIIADALIHNHCRDCIRNCSM